MNSNIRIDEVGLRRRFFRAFVEELAAVNDLNYKPQNPSKQSPEFLALLRMELRSKGSKRDLENAEAALLYILTTKPVKSAEMRRMGAYLESSILMRTALAKSERALEDITRYGAGDRDTMRYYKRIWQQAESAKQSIKSQFDEAAAQLGLVMRESIEEEKHLFGAYLLAHLRFLQGSGQLLTALFLDAEMGAWAEEQSLKSIGECVDAREELTDFWCDSATPTEQAADEKRTAAWEARANRIFARYQPG